MAGRSKYCTVRPTPYISSFSVNVDTNSSGWLSKVVLRPAIPSNFVPSGNAPDASIGVPASASRQRPTGSKFSMAKPIGSIRAWQLAHAGLARCWIIASRMVSGLPVVLPSVFNAGTFGGGGGGGADNKFSSTHLPRFTGDVRFAYDVFVNRLPRPSSPTR